MEPQIPPAVAARIAGAVQSSRSKGARRTYATAWRRFFGWCEREGHVALRAHPVSVAAYLVGAAETRTETGDGPTPSPPSARGSRPSTTAPHHRAPVPNGARALTAMLSGIRREYATGGAPPLNRRAPLLVDDIEILVATA
ncbi:MAG: hypothetical protein U5O16_24315 [Rhodococcus sp. (in: high G+C Gram-positive bacteria)]|uniref:hypothetical protein n=1 Tax=Rhodococcus sp. TaxID=1831 RepID=UPI002AD7B6BA|nr:hypothetical protein [Rhodococcus sp. (in: high G+C Gram-positive bacteria)]